MPLNVDWQQILLHLFNFVILFAVLYFLLYKPVKDFMENRIEHYKKLDEEAKKNLSDSELTKASYQEKLAGVDQEITEQKEKAHKELEAMHQVKMQEAEKEAEKILADARASLDKERDRMLKEAQNEISDMVVQAAKKIMDEPDTSVAYEQFLNTAKRSE